MIGHQVALVITDFRMPFIDGIRLTDRIRWVDANVPIIVMSGDEIGREALAHGANAFVPKRVLVPELRSALTQYGFPLAA